MTVTDAAPSEDVTPQVLEANGSLMPEIDNLGIAVIAGLADDVEVLPGPKGMRIRMSWPASPHGIAAL